VTRLEIELEQLRHNYNVLEAENERLKAENEKLRVERAGAQMEITIPVRRPQASERIFKMPVAKWVTETGVDVDIDISVSGEANVVLTFRKIGIEKTFLVSLEEIANKVADHKEQHEGVIDAW